MSKILVTGGAGFIGSHIARELLKAGHSVKIIDNLSFGSLGKLGDSRKKIVFVNGDIRNRKALLKESKGFDCIMHEAALRSIAPSFENPKKYSEVNINGTINVLDAARANDIERVIIASSSSVYGNSPCQKEDAMPDTGSPYAVTKLACENYAKIYFEAHGLKTVSLRYFNVFGPNQDCEGKHAQAIPVFINKILHNERPVIFGDGKKSRDFTHVANIVSANILAMNAKKGFGEAFNIGEEKTVSILELLSKINEILGKNIKAKHLKERKGEAQKTMADISKARAVLGYSIIEPFDSGLKKTIEWFKQEVI